MRKLFILSIFSIFVIASCTVKYSKDNIKAKEIKGSWRLYENSIGEVDSDYTLTFTDIYDGGGKFSIEFTDQIKGFLFDTGNFSIIESGKKIVFLFQDDTSSVLKIEINDDKLILTKDGFVSYYYLL